MEARRIAASPFGAGALVLWFLSVTACGAPDPDVATHHNDNFRTGAVPRGNGPDAGGCS